MRVGLFIPCYIDQFYPQAGISTFQILVKLGVNVEYPFSQTCCGQPLANSGIDRKVDKFSRKFINIFKDYDYTVCPSGSCTLHVRDHFFVDGHDETGKRVKSHTMELIEFLYDVLQVEEIDAVFEHKVALLQSCHGLRGLRLGSSSELSAPHFSKTEHLLKKVTGIKLLSFDREDECCGFGGTFSVFEEAVSIGMGRDKLNACLDAGAEVVTSYDMSCLMHLEGLARRENYPLRFMHVAEILNSIT